MYGLTLVKEVEKINEALMRLADEHFNKCYIQKLPKNSKEFRLRILYHISKCWFYPNKK